MSILGKQHEEEHLAKRFEFLAAAGCRARAVQPLLARLGAIAPATAPSTESLPPRRRAPGSGPGTVTVTVPGSVCP